MDTPRRLPLQITPSDRLDGVVPGVRGHRAFPTRRGIRNADPFLMLDHIGPQRIDPTRVIDGKPHPHRGFETVSIILAGSLEHVDSLGNRVTLRAGDLQIMHAGRGILHGGDMRPDPNTGEFHEFQLWVDVESARKGSPPQVRNVRADAVPAVNEHGTMVRVLCGGYGDTTATAATLTPTTVLHATMPRGGSWTPQALGADRRVLLYVIGGALTLAGHRAAATQTLDLGRGFAPGPLTAGRDGAECLVLAGRPLEQPVVFGGPFVMNTQAEIERAFADYAAGAFGSIPPAPG
ncbi:MAG: pirin family protein [Myxococcota bacterium]